MGQPVRFYTDEHVARAVVRALRQRGVDVLTVPEAGMMEASDEEHFARAKAEDRVLFTQDAGFLRLATAAGTEHSGIAYVKQGTPIGDIVRGLMLIYQVLDADDMHGHVEYL
jgi:uncharacterized protein with PIN domain